MGASHLMSASLTMLLQRLILKRLGSMQEKRMLLLMILEI